MMKVMSLIAYNFISDYAYLNVLHIFLVRTSSVNTFEYAHNYVTSS